MRTREGRNERRERRERQQREKGKEEYEKKKRGYAKRTKKEREGFLPCATSMKSVWPGTCSAQCAEVSCCAFKTRFAVF